MEIIIPTVISGVLFTVGDILLKEWVLSDQRPLYFVGIPIYLLGEIFLVQTFKHEHIAAALVTVVVLNVSTYSLVDWLVFREGLSALQIIGIGLGSIIGDLRI